MTEIISWKYWVSRSASQVRADSILVLIIVLNLVLVAGCTTTSTSTTSGTGLETGDLERAKIWTMVGKLGIQTPVRNASLGIRWHQQGNNFEINFNGPLGFNLAQILGDADGVRLVHKNKQVNASSPEQLLEDLMGHDFPVSPMEYWVRGLPSPDSSYTQREDGIEQFDWLVTYRRDSRGLPGRVIMSRDEVRLKLFVKSWSY